jgi:hypothetical protein
MRIMQTKIVDPRELSEGRDGILCVYDAVTYRMKELTSVLISSSTACRTNLMDLLLDNFSQQRLDPEKLFQTFAYGIVSRFSPFGRFCLLTRLFLQFKYVYDKKALLTVDYIRNLDPSVSSYDDDETGGYEDQSVQPEPEAILNYNLKDEPSPDSQVYCEQFTDAIPNDGNVEPPLKDLYALSMSRFSNY